ncbi:MAG: hypothetical protein ACRDRO_04695 [Pseudonocardiaceae bacterium]
MIELVFGGLLLVCLGMLLGSAWTTQVIQSQLRRLAEQRRRLNDEWAAIRTIHRQQTECPRCASPLYEHNYFAPTAVEERSDDDCTVGWRIT